MNCIALIIPNIQIWVFCQQIIVIPLLNTTTHRIWAAQGSINVNGRGNAARVQDAAATVFRIKGRVELWARVFGEVSASLDGDTWHGHGEQEEAHGHPDSSSPAPAPTHHRI